MTSIIKKVAHYFTLAVLFYFSSYSGLQRSVWLGIFLSFLNAIFTSLLPFLAIYFANELTLSAENIGVLISCYGVGTLGGGLFGGQLTDKFPPKYISGLCVFLQAFFYATLIFTHSFLFLIFILFGLGVATYGFLTASYTWILSYCKHTESEKFKTLGILTVVSNLGMSLAAILVGFSGTIGFQKLFIISSLMLTFLGIIICSVKKPIIKTNLSFLNTEIQEKSNSIQKTNHKKALYLALICLLLMGSIVAQLNATYPLYIQEAFSQMGLKSVSVLFTISSLLIVFFQAPVVHFFKHFNKLRLVGIGSVLLGLGMFLLIFPIGYWVMIFACIVFSFGEMFFFSSVQLVCYESGDSSKKGQSMGLFRVFYGASRIVGPVIGGLVYHFNPIILWILCGFIGLFCWIICELTRIKIAKN